MIDNSIVKEILPYFEAIKKERELTSEENKILHLLEFNADTFVVSCLMREDLEMRGYDASKVDDATMTRIADKMGDAICDCGVYGESLESECCYLNIPLLKVEDDD